MTKKELLDELRNKFYKVGVIEQADSGIGLTKRKEEGVMWYLVGVYEQRGEVLVRRQIPIYVENDGEQDEKAFYGEKMPEVNVIPEKPTTVFKDEVTAFIKTQIVKGTIIKGAVEGASEKEEYAIVKAYVEEAGEIVEKKFFAYKEAGTIKFTVMKTN